MTYFIFHLSRVYIFPHPQPTRRTINSCELCHKFEYILYYSHLENVKLFITVAYFTHKLPCMYTFCELVL